VQAYQNLINFRGQLYILIPIHTYRSYINVMSTKFRDCILIHSPNSILVLITIILVSITVILVVINDSVVGDMMEGVIVSICECFKEMRNAITKHVGRVAQSV